MNTSIQNEQLLLSDIQLASITGVKLSTIRKWRVVGQGPRWIKLGALVRYRVQDVYAFLDNCPAGGVHVAA